MTELLAQTTHLNAREWLAKLLIGGCEYLARYSRKFAQEHRVLQLLQDIAKRRRRSGTQLWLRGKTQGNNNFVVLSEPWLMSTNSAIHLIVRYSLFLSFWREVYIWSPEQTQPLQILLHWELASFEKYRSNDSKFLTAFPFRRDTRMFRCSL